MLLGGFASPKDEHRPEGAKLLWAASGYRSEPAPPDIHIHRGVEVGILLQGVEEVHYSDFILTCRPGDAWLCNIYEPHGARLVAPPRQSVVFNFLPEFIGGEALGELPWLTLFSVSPEQRPRASSPEMRKRLLEIGQLLHREVEEKRAHWEAVVRLEILRLLLELSREWAAPRLPLASEQLSLGGLDRILPALSLLHSLPWRKVSVGEAAAACALGVSRFQTLFRATMGVSFGEFGLRARVAFAAHRIAHTRRTISAVAAETGFVDGSHLHRHFQRLYGCTPLEYRARNWSVREPGPREDAPKKKATSPRTRRAAPGRIARARDRSGG